MKIQDIIESQDQNAIVAEMQTKRYIEEPDIKQAEKALDPRKHDVFNPGIRPDKKVRIDPDDMDNDATRIMKSDGELKEGYRLEKVARIGLDLPNLIVNRHASMIFGNDVGLICTPADDDQKTVLSVINKIRNAVKEKTINRRIAKILFSCKEVAELWYAVPVDRKDQTKKSSKYGISTPFKMRCAILNPMQGDQLYPYFDETGDMIAFSRFYYRQDQKLMKHTFFETWTDEEHMVWERKGNGFEPIDGFYNNAGEPTPQDNVIGKIPVIFGHQDATEYEKVMNLIDRLEKLLSNFADTNDYHASPKIFVTGTIHGFSKKGESGAILEGEDGAKAEYLSWASAPESVKLEIENLLKFIYTLTQTPDLSFDSVKGLNLSGVSLKLLFTDAYLKVLDHREVFDDYLQRRYNLLAAFVGKMDVKLQDAAEQIEIEPEIHPFIITDDASELQMWQNGNGGNAVMSLRTSVQGAAHITGVSDVDKEVEAIQKENDAKNAFSISEPTDIMDSADTGTGTENGAQSTQSTTDDKLTGNAE